MTEQREQQLEISHRDRINIPPADYQTAETQVRPKAKSKSRASKSIDNLEMVSEYKSNKRPRGCVRVRVYVRVRTCAYAC